MQRKFRVGLSVALAWLIYVSPFRACRGAFRACRVEQRERQLMTDHDLNSTPPPLSFLSLPPLQPPSPLFPLSPSLSNLSISGAPPHGPRSTPCTGQPQAAHRLPTGHFCQRTPWHILVLLFPCGNSRTWVEPEQGHSLRPLRESGAAGNGDSLASTSSNRGQPAMGNAVPRVAQLRGSEGPSGLRASGSVPRLSSPRHAWNSVS